MLHVAETGSCQRLRTLALRPAAGAPGPAALRRHLQVGGECHTAGEMTEEKPVQKKKLVTQCCQLISQRFARSVCGCLRAGKQVVIALSRPPVTPDGPRREVDVRCVNRGRWGRECSEGGWGGWGWPVRLVPLRGRACSAGNKVEGGGGGEGSCCSCTKSSRETKEALSCV